VGEERASLTFRAASVADLPRLAAIDADSRGGGWSKESLARELELAWSRVEVAQLEGEGSIVGFSVVWTIDGELQLLDIAVAKEQRRRGIGRMLLERVTRRATELGATVTLEVRQGNEAARALYGALGFRETGKRRGYYQADGEDAVLMTWEAP
jgi:[ribosomal protein S18]-alanine N-acetyltransferase